MPIKYIIYLNLPAIRRYFDFYLEDSCLQHTNNVACAKKIKI